MDSEWALAYAADELRTSWSFVLGAVRLNGAALQHANNELQEDPEIVIAAMGQIGQAIQDGLWNAVLISRWSPVPLSKRKEGNSERSPRGLELRCVTFEVLMLFHVLRDVGVRSSPLQHPFGLQVFPFITPSFSVSSAALSRLCSYPLILCCLLLEFRRFRVRCTLVHSPSGVLVTLPASTGMVPFMLSVNFLRTAAVKTLWSAG